MNTNTIMGNIARVLVVALAACSTPHVALERFEFSRLCMGVEARIVLHAHDRASAERAAEAAFESIAALDDALSDWKATSELSRVTAVAAHGPVKVSADLFDVLERSLDLARRTEGAFDPTIGPLVLLWRAARLTQQLPSTSELAEARSHVGIDQIELDRRARSVRFTRPGLRLDFGAIGKGYACQRAITVLATRGIESALVAMGGDIVCSAAPPGRTGWRIDLESQGESLIVSNRAVSTSGDREQWVEIDGRRFSHVIDPRTGLGLENHARAIVIGPDGATADALSTALSIQGGAVGLAVVARFSGVEARLEESAGGGGIVRSTPGFARFVQKNPDRR